MDDVGVLWWGREVVIFESSKKFYASVDKTINAMLVEYITCRALYAGDGLDGYARIVTPGTVIMHVWLYLFAWRRLTDLQTEYLISIGLDFAKGTTLVLKLYLREMQRKGFIFNGDMFPYRVIRPACSSSSSSSGGLGGLGTTGKCDPTNVQLMALSAFLYVFDIARFRQSIGMRSLYDEALTSTLTYAVCQIRHAYVRSRFEYISAMKMQNGRIDHQTPADIKRLEDISIRLHLLFPCTVSCTECYRYSHAGDIESISALSYSIAGQYVSQLIAEIKRHAINFDSV